VQDHRAIVEAVMASDSPAAESAMRTHVINGLNYLSELDRNVHYGDG
jgi:DNA-binding FadR family transcriptional regulator